MLPPRLKSIFIHLTIGMLVLTVCTMVRPILVEGKLYSCVDPSGSTIFTDSPSQLENCTLLTIEGSHQSLGAATSIPSLGVSGTSSSKKKTTPIPSSSHDQPSGQPSSTQQQENARSGGSSSEEQVCHSPTNPLNPFLNRPCAPIGD